MHNNETLEKIEEAIKKGQSRDTGNIGHIRQGDQKLYSMFLLIIPTCFQTMMYIVSYLFTRRVKANDNI